VTRRQKAIAFFVAFCVLLVLAAVTLNISWIVINARRSITPLVVLGIIAFLLIIAGIIIYTVFLVLEIKRNEEHDSFINAVTHELKTPIASIRLYLETLQSRAVNEAQRREFYDIMLADADRLHHTVDQVLKAGVAREKPRLAPARLPVDMGELARGCVDLALVRHHLQPGAIQLEAHDDGPLVVQGDAEELRTMLTNLVDNAVKYSGQEVRITVSVAAPAPDSIWVRVQDRGVGIPRKQLKRIFNRFYRVQARGLKQVKGTGLGLYIVRTIARSHGGRVFAQSEGEGRGATFTVELPRASR
jgi:signal transduction histidine kinase